MRPPKPVRFGRLEEDEGTRQRKRYEENLRQKKDQLKQEFEQLEEIRRFDQLSVASLNDFQFKRELDKLSSLRKQRQFKLQNMNKHLIEITKRNERDEEGLHASQQIQLNTGFKSQMTNHQSDSLYQKFQKNLLAKNPNEYSDYICELKSELIRYQQLIESEIEHSKQLDSVESDLIKGKINLQKEIHEIKQMNQASEGRFSNIETLKFLSNEKNLTSKKNLKIIKQELREMEEMRNKWRKIQQDKQNEYQKEINIGEEYVGHNGMKIEEATQKNIDLQNEILQLEDEEQQILNKRYKSLNLIKYIECFERFEEIFMNKIAQDKIVGTRLIDRYEENQTLINLELNKEQIEYEQQQTKNLDRNQLINVINDFFNRHPGGTASIINFMCEKYWQLTMDLQQNNITFENLIQERKQQNHESEDLDNQIQEYFNKNQYIKDEQLQQQDYMNTVAEILVDARGEVAFDTGLIISHQGELRKTTTLNIQSIEMDEASENETLAAKILKLQNLLFNFMLSLSELLHRSAQTLKIVRENSQNMSSSDLDQTVHQILSFVQQIWSKQQFKNETKSKSKSISKQIAGNHHNHHHNTKENVSSIETESQEYEQQIGLYQIQHVFHEVLKSHIPYDAIQQGAKFFFIRCKQDQLIWNLLTPHHLNQFVQNIQKQLKQIKQSKNEQTNIDQIMTTYEFSVLRQDLVQVFCENFQVMLEQYKIMDNKLRDLSSELKVYLKDKDSKFDPKKLDQIQLREGTVIKEAREAISRKMDLYFTGEIKKTLSDYSISNNKQLIKKNSMDQTDFNELEEQNEFQQQQINGQQDIFILDDYKNNNNEEQMAQIRQFFRSKLTQKYDPTIEIKKKQFDEQKKQQQAKQKLSDKDEFEQERDELKDAMNEVWQHNQENFAKTQNSPQELEQFSEKKAVIREVTKRLYGERGATAKTLKSMSIATVIISDIDRLEKQPSAMEEPQLIQNFKMQKKNIHRDLNNEIQLPTLNFLKPTTVYYQRRQQSQDQLRAMAQKKYDLIENGLNIQQQRPNTEHTAINNNLSNKNRKTLQSNSGLLQKKIPINTKDQTELIDKFYARYGDQKTSQQFLVQLMNQKQSNSDQQQLFNGVSLQEFPFSSNKKITNHIYQSSSGGARPKSILVQPII